MKTGLETAINIREYLRKRSSSEMKRLNEHEKCFVCNIDCLNDFITGWIEQVYPDVHINEGEGYNTLALTFAAVIRTTDNQYYFVYTGKKERLEKKANKLEQFSQLLRDKVHEDFSFLLVRYEKAPIKYFLLQNGKEIECHTS